MIEDKLWLDLPNSLTTIRVDRIVCVYLTHDKNHHVGDEFKGYIVTKDIFDGDDGYVCHFDSMKEARQFKETVIRAVSICMQEIYNPIQNTTEIEVV